MLYNQKSEFRNQKSEIARRHPIINHQSRRSFTLIEMLVVIGIILLVSAISLPLFIGMSKSGKLGQAEETIESACLIARSRAITKRRKFSVTILEYEKCVIVNDYSLLENLLPLAESGDCQDSSSDTLEGDSVSWAANEWAGYYVTLSKGDGIGQQRLIKSNTADTLTVDQEWQKIEGTSWQYPQSSDQYLTGGKDALVVCPHHIHNFDPTGSYTDEEKARTRYDILKTFAIGGIRSLPDGVSLDLDDDSATYDPRSPQRHAWTWIFLPTGGAITLDADAQNQRDEHWHKTTFTSPSTNKPAGPRIYGPNDEQSSIIIVYAMTGQAQSK